MAKTISNTKSLEILLSKSKEIKTFLKKEKINFNFGISPEGDKLFFTWEYPFVSYEVSQETKKKLYGFFKKIKLRYNEESNGLSLKILNFPENPSKKEYKALTSKVLELHNETHLKILHAFKKYAESFPETAILKYKKIEAVRSLIYVDGYDIKSFYVTFINAITDIFENGTNAKKGKLLKTLDEYYI